MLLIGRYLSPFTRRVAVTLNMLGFEFKNQPLTAWDNLEAVRLLNPLGRVPALMLEDGEVLIDSAAILDYIDEMVGPAKALTPQSGPKRRAVLRLSYVAVGAMEKAGQIRWETAMRPSDKIHEPWVDHNRSQILSALEWLESQVQGPWMLGENMTQADISVAVLCEFLPLVNPTLFTPSHYPKLESLLTRMCEYPAFTTTHPIV